MYRTSAPLLLALALLSACNDPKRACEHAKDVMAAHWTRASNEALYNVAPDARDALKKAAEAEHATASGRFVELCVALPEPAAKCIARIEEILTAHQQMREARSKCARNPEGMPDPKCEAAAEAKAEQVNAGCDDALESFNEQLFAP